MSDGRAALQMNDDKAAPCISRTFDANAILSSGTVFGVAIRPQGDAPPLLSKLVRYLHGKAPETRDIFAVDDVNEREINALKRRVSVGTSRSSPLSSANNSLHYAPQVSVGGVQNARKRTIRRVHVLGRSSCRDILTT